MSKSHNKPIWIKDSLSIPNQDAILHFFANQIAQKIHKPAEKIFEALLSREALQTTNVGKGIAIPHCLIDDVETIQIGFLKLDKPIIFSQDKNNYKPCDLFTCIISDKNAGTDYLKTLAKVSRFFRDVSNQNAIRAENNISSLYTILKPIGI